MLLDLQITESLPPHHVGAIDVDWHKVAGRHQDSSDIGALEACVTRQPALESMLRLADEDARVIFRTNANLEHVVRIHSGGYATSVLGLIKNNFMTELGGRRRPDTFVNPRGVLHLDIGNPGALNYLASSVVSTEHALGRFMTAGFANETLAKTLTPLLLALQQRRALYYQPIPNEVVRITDYGVHRSPRRIVEPGVHHVFVSDTVRVL